MQTLKNLTSKTVDVGRRINLPSGELAALELKSSRAEEFDGLAILQKRVTAVKGVPDPDPEHRILYIVDPEIQIALPNRSDLVSATPSASDPSTNELYRWDIDKPVH